MSGLRVMLGGSNPGGGVFNISKKFRDFKSIYIPENLLQGIYMILQGIYMRLQGIYMRLQGIYIRLQGIYMRLQGIYMRLQGIYTL